MGFKLPGKSMTSGTSAHSSALKMQTEQNAASALKYTTNKGNNPPPVPKDEKVEDKKMSNKDWKKGQESAKSSGRDLDKLVASRKGLKKGSDEYNVIQNQINKALGSKKRHGATSATTTEGKTTSTTKVTPGLSATDISTKVSRGGKKKVTKKRYEDEGGITTRKYKTISDKEGNVKRTKKVIKSDYDKDSKVDKKTKIKTNVKKGTTKRVTKEGGRRTVTKTKDGVTTTKSKRTLKGWLTGKGKGKRTKTVTPVTPAKHVDKIGEGSNLGNKEVADAHNKKHSDNPKWGDKHAGSLSKEKKEK